MAQHEVLGRAADIRAIPENLQMARFRMAATDADAVGQGLHAGLVAFAARRNAGAHVDGVSRLRLVGQACAPIAGFAPGSSEG